MNASIAFVLVGCVDRCHLTFDYLSPVEYEKMKEREAERVAYLIRVATGAVQVG